MFYKCSGVKLSQWHSSTASGTISVWRKNTNDKVNLKQRSLFSLKWFSGKIKVK